MLSLYQRDETHTPNAYPSMNASTNISRVPEAGGCKSYGQTLIAFKVQDSGFQISAIHSVWSLKSLRRMVDVSGDIRRAKQGGRLPLSLFLTSLCVCVYNICTYCNIIINILRCIAQGLHELLFYTVA